MKEKIGEILETLAAKLGVTIDHLWTVLVAQAKNQAIERMALYGLLIAVTVGFIMLMHQWSKEKEEDDDSDFLCGATLVGGAFIALFWVLAISSIGTFLAMFNNPEYVALKNVFGMISGK